MSAIDWAGVVLAGVNAAAALVLAAVYWRNHRAMRSPFTLGLLLFAAFLFVHNALIIYDAYDSMMLKTGRDGTRLFVEELLQLGACGALLWATMR